jgi:NADPH:quinone reductase-like Zn-dependent oxidoreductase
VTGAAGAYGGYVIQLAKAEGLTVIADASEKDEKLVEFPLDTQNGADTSFQVPRDPPHPSFGRRGPFNGSDPEVSSPC